MCNINTCTDLLYTFFEKLISDNCCEKKYCFFWRFFKKNVLYIIVTSVTVSENHVVTLRDWKKHLVTVTDTVTAHSVICFAIYFLMRIVSN